jgi:hypothetical protein
MNSSKNGKEKSPSPTAILSKRKKFVFTSILMLLITSVMEIALSTKYFQDHAAEPLAIIHYSKRLPGLHFPSEKSTDIGIFESDPRYGYNHIADSKGTHQTQKFCVTYTIGANRARITPQKTGEQKTVLFVGGSHTFGYGVDDHEAFPAILGQDAWNQWSVENRAVTGWGTSHALLTVRDALESQSLPEAVIYVMIPHHFNRNYLRRSWVSGVAEYGFKHPHFELVEEVLEFQGLAGVAESLEDGLGVRRKEVALTEAMITTMHNETKAKGVQFVLVLLPRQFLESQWPPQFIDAIYRTGMNVLDLTELEPDFISENDRHPTKEMHRRIAKEIHAWFTPKLLNKSP